MKRIKSRSTIGLIVIFPMLVVFLWAGAGSVFSGETKQISGEAAFSTAKSLDGKWVRRDGSYTLAIKDIKSDGNVNASYFNPEKINVHTANWKMQEKSVSLFVELRDEHYPGSSYSLTYVKERDALEGSYFHAVQKQSYRVAFMRVAER